MSRVRAPFGERSAAENAAPMFSPVRGKSPGVVPERPVALRVRTGAVHRGVRC
jgi:hypothetical protein